MDGYHGLWVGTLAPSTIFYFEYQNYGPGSSTKNRVKWKGVETINLQVASQIYSEQIRPGNKWISASGAPYQPGLSRSLFLSLSL